MDYDIPKEQRYLLKYFTTDLQVAFLRYWLVFGNWKCFVDHTGYFCTKRILQKFVLRYQRLVKAHAEAKAEFSEEGMERLLQIEMGEY